MNVILECLILNCFLGNSSKINEVITNFPQRFVAEVSVLCLLSPAAQRQLPFLHCLPRFLYVSLSPFVLSTKKTGQMIFFPSHFANLEGS